MPTASEALRGKIDQHFGAGIDSWKPLKFLLENGWQDAAGLLIPPEREITPKEWDCVAFLVDEWDFAYSRKRQGSSVR